MEIFGFEPKLTICKIAVLPIKLYPLLVFSVIAHKGIEPLSKQWKSFILTFGRMGLFLKF